jgi:hypothetical protein
MTRGSVLQTTAAIALLVLAGLIAFIPLFGVLFTGPVNVADWPVGSVLAASVTLIAYFIGGLLLGRWNPRLWGVAALLAWPCVLSSLANLAGGTGVSLALILLVVPTAAALAGDYLERMRHVAGPEPYVRSEEHRADRDEEHRDELALTPLRRDDGSVHGVLLLARLVSGDDDLAARLTRTDVAHRFAALGERVGPLDNRP